VTTEGWFGPLTSERDDGDEIEILFVILGQAPALIRGTNL